MTEGATVFFVTPLGDVGSPARRRADDVEQLVRPLVEEQGMALIRADHLRDPGRITTQVIRAIADAVVIVADLTGHNPNVMYEVGVADALGKPVVVISDDPAALPFDRAQERALTLGSMHFRDVPEFRSGFAADR